MRSSSCAAHEIRGAGTHVFASCFDGLLDRLVKREPCAYIHEFDQAWQVDARKHFDLALLEQRQGKIARCPAEHIRCNDHTAAEVDRFCCGGDFALATLDVVLRTDADRAKVGLRAHHVLHCGNEFLCQTAVCNQNDTDHGSSRSCGAR